MPKGIPNPKPVEEITPDAAPTVDIVALEQAADAFVAAETTDDVTPEDEPLFIGDVVPESVWVDYSPDEIRMQDASYLRQRAKQWRDEVALESIKAAANQLTMQAMNWAATQLDNIADVLLLFPMNHEIIPVEESDPD